MIERREEESSCDFVPSQAIGVVANEVVPDLVDRAHTRKGHGLAHAVLAQPEDVVDPPFAGRAAADNIDQYLPDSIKKIKSCGAKKYVKRFCPLFIFPNNT